MYIELFTSLNLERSLNIVIGNIGKDFGSFFLRHGFLLNNLIIYAILKVL
jgi:hypothetical protein